MLNFILHLLSGTVGDSFLEKTSYDGASCLAWSFNVLNLAFRRALISEAGSKRSVLGGLGIEARGAISDVVHILKNSEPAFKAMLKLLKYGEVWWWGMGERCGERGGNGEEGAGGEARCREIQHFEREDGRCQKKRRKRDVKVFIFSSDISTRLLCSLFPSPVSLLVYDPHTRYPSRYLRYGGDTQLMAFLRKGKKMLLALNTGDSILLPIIIEKREILMVVQRTSERAFTFVVINTDAQNGLEYVKLQRRVLQS